MVYGVLVLLAGIVGMHGLSTHTGGMAPDAHAVALHEPAAAPMSAAPLPAAPEVMVMVTAVHVVAGAVAAMGPVVVDGVPGGHLGMDMTAMCMAVLAIALTVLRRMLGGAPSLPLYRRAVALGRAPGPHGRDPDPPSLTVLSIRRC